jgi:outer membrane protein TolC
VTAGRCALTRGVLANAIALALLTAPRLELAEAQVRAHAPSAWPAQADLPPLDRPPVGEGRPLTLASVLASVEHHHPELEVARLSVRAAEGERLSAEGAFDLSLTAQGYAAPVGYYDWARADVRLEQPTALWGATFVAGYRVGRGRPLPDYYGEHETLPGGEVRAGLVVPLLRGGPIDARRARSWRAEQAIVAEEEGMAARRLGMQREAAHAYFRWVAAGLRVRIASDLLALAQTRDAQVRARVDAGAIPPIEALENQRTIVARRQTLIAAIRGLERAAIALSLYVRRADGSPRVPAATEVPLDLVSESRAPDPIDERRAIRRAWESRPELDRYRALVEQSRIELEHANNAILPRVDLALGTSVDLGDVDEPDEQARLGQPVVEGSILVSIPLQNRDARGRIERVSAELASKREEARLQRDQIAAEVRDALSAVNAARLARQNASRGAELADAVARAERTRFDLGDTQLFIVNLREQAAAEARAMEVDAWSDLEIALAAFRTATGDSP